MLAIVNRLEATRELDPFHSHVVVEKQVVGRRAKETVVLVRTDEIREVGILVQENRDVESPVVNLDRTRSRSAWGLLLKGLRVRISNILARCSLPSVVCSIRIV